MDESDTATVELSREEAREVINALSDYQYEVSGREEERALNLRELLKREFGFEDRHFEADAGLLDAFGEIFGDDDDPHEVEFSRAEAAEVDDALAELGGSNPDEGETIADVRRRFERAFDLEDRDAA